MSIYSPININNIDSRYNKFLINRSLNLISDLRNSGVITKEDSLKNELDNSILQNKKYYDKYTGEEIIIDNTFPDFILQNKKKLKKFILS